MSRNVLVIGGGEVGAHLAGLLLEWGYLPTMVENRQDAVSGLRQRFTHLRVVEGNATDPEVLEAAGARQAQIVAAVTGDDEVNLTVASLARFEFAVPRTVARVNVPGHAWMFTPAMGVDVGLNQAEVLAHLVVEEASTADMLTLLKLGGGCYSLVETQVGPLAPARGQSIASLALPEDCLVVGILRQGQVLLPRGPTRVAEGDRVLALMHQDHTQDLMRLFEASPPEALG